MNRLQRLVAKLIGIEPPMPKPTSVPDPTMSKFLEIINRAAADTLAQTGVDQLASRPGVHIIRFPRNEEELTARAEAQRPGIKPPADPQIDGMTWAIWKQIMTDVALEGWSPCRFANRTGMNEVGMVFGAAWTEYGIYEQNFHVCGDDAEWTTLAALTFLPSGLGFGVFESKATAAAAAKLARPILYGMSVDDSEMGATDWRERKDRLFQTWRFNGIDEHADRHVHREDGGVLPIWSQIEQPKPEVLA